MRSYSAFQVTKSRPSRKRSVEKKNGERYVAPSEFHIHTTWTSRAIVRSKVSASANPETRKPNA
ncbi:MAG: hypothetical protein LBE18_07785 [Planctomycetaceae bacterium]|nr:hypothetical protein [Planctomycetaceae bacterium]